MVSGAAGHKAAEMINRRALHSMNCHFPDVDRTQQFHYRRDFASQIKDCPRIVLFGN